MTIAYLKDLFTVYTGEGIWNPLVLLIAIILILLVVYLMRKVGAVQKGGSVTQLKPFMSGNSKEPEGEVGADDMYWGFLESFRGLYKPLMRIHTGIVNDYVGLFVVLLALMLLIIILL